MKRLLGLLACSLLCTTLDAVPPQPLQNYVPVVVVNSTTQPPADVYFLAHGNDPNGIPCFLVPDVNGVCQYVYPTPSGTPSSASSSVSLANLPVATGTTQTDPAYLIYLPINSSSRAYFSIQRPMYLATTLNPALGVLGINDSSVTSLTDPNYYTLYQDMEFGVDSYPTGSNTNLYLNLSYVDYFCLPMHLTSYNYPANTEILTDKSQPSGFPSSVSRSTILGTTNTGLNVSADWESLALGYYANPYVDTTPTTYLRILAAKNSIDLGINPIQYQGAQVPQTFFPEDYVHTSAAGPVISQSYMTTLYNFYNTANPGNPLHFQIFPQGVPSTVIYRMEADTTPNTLVFTLEAGPVGAPNPIYIDLNALTTEKLFSGATWPFTTSSPNAAYTNEISKLLSALYTIGRLPYTAVTSSGSPFVNNNGGFAALSYFVNPLSYINGPWHNLYDKVLHLQFVSTGQVPANPTLGLAYGYDYDDLLNMSGIINGMEIQNQYGNPTVVTGPNAYSKPYIVVTLGAVPNGSLIPDISNDAYAYPVTVGSAPNGVDVSFTINGSPSPVHASQTSQTSLGTVTVNSSQPFLIHFNYGLTTYTYEINLLRQIVTPQSMAPFTAIDQYFQGSVVFTVTGSIGSPVFTISFISTPPPWPG